MAHFPNGEAVAKIADPRLAEALKQEIAATLADPAMVWHPANPQYPLRKPCP